MNWMKFEWKYVREVYGPQVADKQEYEEYEVPQPANDGAQDDQHCRERAHELAWEAMWREVDAFWVRSGAALVILGGATSLLFQSGWNPVESAFLGVGLLLMTIVWRQINLGSLSWMGSWMTHVDTLEDDITGPLYKTVFHEHTHSTTKSIANLSLMGVWAGTMNAVIQVIRAANEAIDLVEKDCPGLVGTEGRLALIGGVLILFTLFIGMFIHWNISFTKDENEKKRYLRRVKVGPDSEPGEPLRVMQVRE